MAIGQKTGSLRNLKKTLSKGSGGTWIKYIPKNGSKNIRFIEEPEEWVTYTEHWDSMLRKSYPCNEESTCPGCAASERKSARYLANAIDLDDKDRVIALQLPKDLANRLVVKYEKWGSLTDRELELSRSGDGLDTVYDLDAGPKDQINLGKFQPLDLLKILEESFEAVFGAEEATSNDSPKKSPESAVKTTRKKSAATEAINAPVADNDEDEDDEDDVVEEVVETPKPKPKGKKKVAEAPEPQFTPDVEDEDDDDDEPDVDDDDDQSWTEEALRALPLGALRSVARTEFGVSTKGLNGDQIIEAIFEAGEVTEDDESNGMPF